MLASRHATFLGNFEPCRNSQTPLQLTSTRRASPRTNRNAGTVKVHARLDPYKTLGVSHDADEKEIKRAHRRLVLEHHPDRAHGKEGVEVKFLAIQEAYEILTGKRRGKEVDSGPASGWDFHDWFWRFKFSRRQGSASAQAPPPPEAVRERLREQLSGLKAKAAAKRAAGPRRPAHAAQARNPSEAAAASVWRSTTKNARTTQQKPAEEKTVHTAFASKKSSTLQERLHAETEFATATATTTVREEIKSEDVEKLNDASSPIGNSASEPLSTSTSTVGASSSSSTAADQQAWRSLLTRAVHVVHDLHHRHNHSVTTHAQRIQSQISSIGSKLSQKLQLHALHELMPELSINNNFNENENKTLNTINFSQWKQTGFRFSASATIGNAFGRGTAGAGVPSEKELHVLFSDTLNHHNHSTHHYEKKSAVTATASREAAASSSGEDSNWQQGYPKMDSHSRKFADKEHVKTRLSTQLTGLKRRSALKREFDDLS